MNKTEEKHIREFGVDRFWKLYAECMYEVKQSPKLVAAPKLRETIAYLMAIKRSGYADVKPFSLAKKSNQERFGPPSQELQDICDEFLK